MTFTRKLTFLIIRSTIFLISSTDNKDFQCTSPINVMFRPHFISSNSWSMEEGGITCCIFRRSRSPPLPDLERRRFSVLRDLDRFLPRLRSRSLSFFFFFFVSSTSILSKKYNKEISFI